MTFRKYILPCARGVQTVEKLSNKNKKRRNKNKTAKPVYKSRRTAITAITVIAAAAICIGGYFIWKHNSESLPEWGFDNSVFTDKENNIEYAMAPIAFQPYSVGNDYAHCGSIIISEIPKLDPLKYLVIDLEGDYTVLYDNRYEMPSLSEFEPETIKICSESETIVQIGLIDDAQLVKRAAAELEGGLYGGPALDNAVIYHMKFTSSLYDRLYYDVVYVESDTGNYLYDRAEQRYAEVGRMFKGYIADDTGESADTADESAAD